MENAQTWTVFRDKICNVIEEYASQADLDAFDTWYASEIETAMAYDTPALQLKHVSWGLDGLRVGGDVDDGVVDRMLDALREVSETWQITRYVLTARNTLRN